ncbi:Transcription initiation factor TFIID subunit A [Musa troglodytarum]|uniref:Transcription initiation factor TFIID subunit A n=1 Tax=Musa troglodytarum TaxID=320322 RepID=A0A9E7GND9_9LILI|nr:Transcription initiation factor TFIID subunit A [Musa troglodytarum]
MRNWGFGKGTLKGPFGGTTEDRAVYTCRCFDRSDALRFWIVQLHRFLVTATLSLAVACSSAGVTVLFVKDVNFCSKYHELSCGRYQISTAMAFITCLLPAKTSLLMFLLLCFDDDQQSLPGLITASFLLQNHLSVPEHVEKLVDSITGLNFFCCISNNLYFYRHDIQLCLTFDYVPASRKMLHVLDSSSCTKTTRLALLTFVIFGRADARWFARLTLLQPEQKHNSGNHTLPAEQAIHRPTQQQDRGIGLDATRSRRRGADQLSLDDRQHRFALYNKATREMVGFSCRCEGCMLSGSRRENPSHPFPCRFAPKSPVSPLRLASSSPSTHLRRFDAAEVFLGGETDRERK